MAIDPAEKIYLAKAFLVSLQRLHSEALQAEDDYKEASLSSLAAATSGQQPKVSGTKETDLYDKLRQRRRANDRYGHRYYHYLDQCCIACRLITMIPNTEYQRVLISVYLFENSLRYTQEYAFNQAYSYEKMKRMHRHAVAAFSDFYMKFLELS